MGCTVVGAEQKKISIQNEEQHEIHEILTVSKHSNSEVGLACIALGGSAICVCGGCQPPTLGRGVSHQWRGECWLPTVGGIGGSQQEGKFIDPCVAKIEFGKAGEVENITKKLKGIVS